MHGITGTSFEDTTAAASQYYYYHVKAYSSTAGYSSFIGGTMNKGYRL